MSKKASGDRGLRAQGPKQNWPQVHSGGPVGEAVSVTGQSRPPTGCGLDSWGGEAGHA